MGDDEPASPPSGALTDNHPRPQSRRWSSPSSPERRERCSPAHTPARDGRGRRRRRPSPLARASREVPAQVLSHFLAVENRNHYRANSCQLLGYLFKTTIIDAQDSNFMINNHSIMIFIKQRYFVFFQYLVPLSVSEVQTATPRARTVIYREASTQPERSGNRTCTSQAPEIVIFDEFQCIYKESSSI